MYRSSSIFKSLNDLKSIFVIVDLSLYAILSVNLLISIFFIDFQQSINFCFGKLNKHVDGHFLISKNKEAEWTAIQGKVYGKRMLKALPYKGVIQFIQKISKEKKFKIFIVSHKTLHPIVGEKINLHKLSRKWIEKNKIFISRNNNFKNQILFLKTKEKKINKIVNLK